MKSNNGLLKDLAGLYTNFKINSDFETGTLKVGTRYGLKVSPGLTPSEWKVFDATSGDFKAFVGSEVEKDLQVKEFIDTLNQLLGKPGENKSLDNLKDEGFDLSDVPATHGEQESKEAWDEVKKQEEAKKEPSKKESSWKKGGYEEKVKDAVFEEVEPPRKVVSRRTFRSIKGLTPRLAECGKIKIGIKGKLTTSAKGNQFRAPQKLDHFIVTTMEKTEGDDFKQDEELMKKIGSWDNFGGYHCTEIPVRLPYDDPTLNFPTSYAYYDSAACKCRGDGETAVTAEGEAIECNPEICKYAKENKCKPNGVLSLILDDAPRVGGVYKFRTTGWNSINNIYSSMEFIRGLTNGFLAGLPLMLTLTPKHTTVPGTKTPTTIYMVNLEYRGSLSDMVKAIKQTMDTRALMQYSIKDFEKLAEEALALPEAPEECKEIVDEFYPEVVA